MANLVFIHASDGSNALLAREVEGYAVNMGHTVDHVSLNACDFPVYTVKREKEAGVLPGLAEPVATLRTASHPWSSTPSERAAYWTAPSTRVSCTAP